MSKFREVPFSELVGQTLGHVEVNFDEDEITFYTPTRTYKMFHDRS